MRIIFCRVFVFAILGIGPWRAQAQQTPRVSHSSLGGSHLGVSDDNGAVPMHLILKPMPYRQGAYLGILLEAESSGFLGLGAGRIKNARIYLVEPKTEGGLFLMFRIGLLENLRPGKVSIEPELVLSVENFGNTGRPQLRIRVAGGVVDSERLLRPAKFSGEQSNMRWNPLHPGKYEGADNNFTFGSLAPDSSSPTSFSSPILNSSEGIVEGYLQYIFSLQPVVFRRDGPQKIGRPTGIGVFVSLGTDLYWVLVDRNPDVFKSAKVYEWEKDLSSVPGETSDVGR